MPEGTGPGRGGGGGPAGGGRQFFLFGAQGGTKPGPPTNKKLTKGDLGGGGRGF